MQGTLTSKGRLNTEFHTQGKFTAYFLISKYCPFFGHLEKIIFMKILSCRSIMFRDIEYQVFHNLVKIVHSAIISN